MKVILAYAIIGLILLVGFASAAGNTTEMNQTIAGIQHNVTILQHNITNISDQIVQLKLNLSENFNSIYIELNRLETNDSNAFVINELNSNITNLKAAFYSTANATNKSISAIESNYIKTESILNGTVSNISINKISIGNLNSSVATLRVTSANSFSSTNKNLSTNIENENSTHNLAAQADSGIGFADDLSSIAFLFSLFGISGMIYLVFLKGKKINKRKHVEEEEEEDDE